MLYSRTAWKQALPLINAIKAHPFNQELMQGTLNHARFSYYIEQDSQYLKEFARGHALIAAKIDIEFVRTCIKFAENAFVAEQDIVHQFFKSTMNLTETGLLSPATLSYTSYLLRNCALESVEVAMATMLPCFWVYQEVGQMIAKASVRDNPYAHWIETYSSENFALTVKQAIDIFDQLALNANPATQQKMLKAFYTSTSLEWHFWNDAYHLRALDDFL